MLKSCPSDKKGQYTTKASICVFFAQIDTTQAEVIVFTDLKHCANQKLTLHLPLLLTEVGCTANALFLLTNPSFPT